MLENSNSSKLPCFAQPMRCCSAYGFEVWHRNGPGRRSGCRANVLRFARPGTISKRIGGNLKNFNMRCSKSLIQTDLGSSAEELSDAPGAREIRLRQTHRANNNVSSLQCNVGRPTVLRFDLEMALGGEHFQDTGVGERSSGISTMQSAALCLLLCEPTPPQARHAVWISLRLSRKERIPPA